MEFLFAAILMLPHLWLMGPLVHIYQLESYQAPGYVRSVKQNIRVIYSRLLVPWALPMAAGVLTGSFGLPGWAAGRHPLYGAEAAARLCPGGTAAGNRPDPPDPGPYVPFGLPGGQ